MFAADKNAGIAVPLRDKGVAIGGVGDRGRERASARSNLPLAVNQQHRADLRQGFEVGQKPMELAVMLDTVPVEAADTVIDPRKYQRIGLDRTERMFVQLAGLDGDPLFGLELDQPEVLPGGNSQEQQRYGEGRHKQEARRPRKPALRALRGRIRLGDRQKGPGPAQAEAEIAANPRAGPTGKPADAPDSRAHRPRQC